MNGKISGCFFYMKEMKMHSYVEEILKLLFAGTLYALH